MTHPYAVAMVIRLSFLLGLAVLTYAVLWRSLKSLLDELIRLPAGTTFYLRSLTLIVVFVALQNWDKPSETPQHFMQYVWFAAAPLSDALQALWAILLVYLTLITILTAVLRRRHGE